MLSAIEAYEAAHEGGILVDRSALGILQFKGETRLDLLHRMSTQDLRHLASGEGAATILTSEIGRMIDRLLLYAGSDAIYAATGEDNAVNVARYLLRFVFFKDDFQVEDLSGETALFGVYGAQAARLLEKAGFPEVNLPLHHWRQEELGGATAYLHKSDPLAGDGYFVICQEEDRAAVWQALLDAGLQPAGEDGFDLLRIEYAQPRFGREITPDYIPLEANLWPDVSFTKGCYIGQEIIARMESRGKLARRLVKLYAPEVVAAGAEIRAEGKKAGTVTSSAVGPNGPVLLAYIKTTFLDNNAPLAVGESPLRLDDS